jgi:RNA polymerase sigma-70 factor (ECF subfamily)
MNPSEQSGGLTVAGRDFRTTHWSVVLRAGQQDTPESAAALETLCRGYWYPLYAYVRRRGYREHDAEDLTQAFFAHLLERRAFRAVGPARGRFRSFLLASLNHFIADERDRQQAQKRGGGRQIISFDAHDAEQRYRLEPVDLTTPEKLFERRWAVTLLDAALARLEQEFAAAGKAELFEQLRAFIVEGAENRTYAEVAAQLGMTEDAVKKAAQRLRRRYQEAIREEIAHTVATASEIEEELRYLWSVLGG